MHTHLSIDIGATKTLVGMFDKTGKLKESIKYATTIDQRAFNDKLLNTCNDFIRRHGGLESIGLGVPGLVEPGGTFTSLNLAWKNADLKHRLEKEFAVNVTINNDVNFAALAEARLGSAAGCKSALYVSLSTGVGTAIITNGTIPDVMQNSECGLMLASIETDDTRSSPESIESIVSGRGFYRHFKSRPEVTDDFNIWQKYARNLSRCLFNMSVIFLPEVIVLGGGVTNSYSKFKVHLKKDFEHLFPENCRVPIIKRAKFLKNGVLYGSYEASK